MSQMWGVHVGRAISDQVPLALLGYRSIQLHFYLDAVQNVRHIASRFFFRFITRFLSCPGSRCLWCGTSCFVFSLDPLSASSVLFGISTIVHTNSHNKSITVSNISTLLEIVSFCQAIMVIALRGLAASGSRPMTGYSFDQIPISLSVRVSCM